MVQYTTMGCVDSEQQFGQDLNALTQYYVSMGIPSQDARLFLELVPDHTLHFDTTFETGSTNALCLPITVREPMRFLRDLRHFADAVIETSHPSRDWYQFRLLPRAIRLNGFEFKKHLGLLGSIKDIFYGATAYVPSGDKMYPEFRLQTLIESLHDGKILPYVNRLADIGQVECFSSHLFMKICPPTHVLRHLQDTPLEMQLSIGSPSFRNRLHNARFLPLGDLGVLLASVQVPDYLHNDGEGITEHDLAQYYIEHTNQGERLFHMYYHSVEMRQLIGHEHVGKYEFKSKPVHYLEKYKERLQSVISASEVATPADLISLLRKYLSYVRESEKVLPEAKRDYFTKYCIDDIVEIIKGIRAKDILDECSYSDIKLRNIASSVNWLNHSIKEIPAELQLCVDAMMVIHDRCLAMYGLSILTDALNHPNTTLEALLQYEQRRNNMQKLNKPFRGAGSPSERISITTFIQAMHQIGYDYLYVHTENNEWPTHREIIMDEKLKTQKQLMLKFIFDIAQASGAHVRSVANDVYYKIEMKPIVEYLSKSKYPTIIL